MQRRRQYGNLSLAGAVLVLACLLGAAGSLAIAAGSEAPVLYLPLVMRNLPIQFDAPIWVHDTAPAQHEVVLFRRSFRLARPLEAAELHIFADTRYEVWVDGAWVGRGPARFSRTLREYDALQLGLLAPGDHLIAVLVQWAPNIRRSESTEPVLMAHLQGETEAGPVALVQTGPNWKSSLTNAWKADAQLVDTRFLIGPTELLDFRLLPAGWNQPAYDDSSWPAAISRTAAEPATQPVAYAPRSILPLENASMPIVVQDAGLLSPGFLLGELVPPVDDPYVLRFSISQPADLVIETLSSQSPDPERFKVDGQALAWQAAGPTRPDVYRSVISLSASAHRLRISEIPPEGTTFGVSAPGASFGEIPFQQGRHAGRRVLLAEPLSAPGFVQLAETPNGWRLEFNTLPAYIVLDLGRTVHGRIVADISGPAGSIVDIGWDERLRTETHRPLPYPGSMYPQWNQVDSWALDGGTRRLTTLDARSGRYILISVWGGGPVRLDNLRVYEERYPLVQVGQFHSSDPLLDQIWQVGVDTLRPNMTDALTDTPWRERGQWWGDAYIEDRVSRIAFGDTALLRRGLVYMADAMRQAPSPGKAPNNGGLHMLDYTMLWVHSMASEVTATHDQDLARRLYPLVKLFIDHLKSFANPQTGLLDLPQQHWSFTAYIDLFGFDSRYGQSAALNALYADTLRQAAQIADLLGDIDQATDWREQALDVQTGLNAFLYQPLDGRYLTSIYLGAPVPPTIHAQAWPLAYGLAPADQETNVADALLEMLPSRPGEAELGIYGMSWVLDGLAQAGYISEALDVIRLYYGYLLDNGATTWWEGFDANLHPEASFSHGWGGAPTWFLTTYLLGAQRLGPDTWRVAPSFEGVDFASGVLPLKNGVLDVRWERLSCGETRLHIRAVEGSQGQVILPRFHPDLTLSVNDELLWGGGSALADRVTASDAFVTLELEGGLYEVVGRYPCAP